MSVLTSSTRSYPANSPRYELLSQAIRGTRLDVNYRKLYEALVAVKGETPAGVSASTFRKARDLAEITR